MRQPDSQPLPLLSARQAMLAVIAGAASALTIAPFGLHWLAWGAMVPMLFAVQGASGRSAFVCGLLAGLTLFLALGYGVFAFHAGAFVAVVVALAMQLGIVFAAYAALQSRPLPAWLRPLVLPSLWVLAEWLSSFANVPWAAALSQTNNLMLIQPAAVLGACWVSFLLLLGNQAVFTVLAARHGGPARRERGALLWAPAMAGAALAGSLSYGWWTLAHRPADPASLRVASIQPVIMPDTYRYQGMVPAFRRAIAAVVERLSAAALEEQPDVLAWPEGGNGQFNLRVQGLRDAWTRLAGQSGSGLLLSGYDLDENARMTNSVFSLSPAGEVLGRYDKVRLTPMGEREFSPGTRWDPLPTAYGPVGALVCFESTFAAPAREMVAKGAVLLLVTTSDASFRNSNLGMLHALSSIYRAVENRRALIQTSNTGPSFLVSPYGEVSDETALFAETVLAGRVTARQDRTFFTRAGELPLLGLCALALLVACAYGRARGSEHAGAAQRPTRRRSAPIGAGPLAGGIATALAAGSLLALGSLLLTSGHARRFDGSWSAALAYFFRPATVPLTADSAAAFRQRQPNTCGPAALAYLASYLGMEVHEESITPLLTLRPEGTSLADLAAAARQLGLTAWGEKQNFAALEQTPKPVIAHIRDDHYVVVLAIEHDDSVDIFDPSAGYRRVPRDQFSTLWRGNLLLVRFPAQIR